MERIKQFISIRENAYVILTLSAYQNILSKSVNLYRNNFEDKDFEFSYYIFTDLVYSFFLDYFDLSKKDFDFETFENIFYNEILTENDWETINNFSDFFLFGDEEFTNQYFLGHNFNFKNMNNSLNVASCQCVFTELNFLNSNSFSYTNSLIDSYVTKMLKKEMYEAKYKTIIKFEVKKWSVEKLCEYWKKLFNKLITKLFKKRKIKRNLCYPILYWYFYGCILLVFHARWINLLSPSRAEELETYKENYKKQNSWLKYLLIWYWFIH